MPRFTCENTIEKKNYEKGTKQKEMALEDCKEKGGSRNSKMKGKSCVLMNKRNGAQLLL